MAIFCLDPQHLKLVWAALTQPDEGAVTVGETLALFASSRMRKLRWSLAEVVVNQRLHQLLMLAGGPGILRVNARSVGQRPRRPRPTGNAWRPWRPANRGWKP